MSELIGDLRKMALLSRISVTVMLVHEVSELALVKPNRELALVVLLEALFFLLLVLDHGCLEYSDRLVCWHGSQAEENKSKIENRPPWNLISQTEDCARSHLGEQPEHEEEE